MQPQNSRPVRFCRGRLIKGALCCLTLLISFPVAKPQAQNSARVLSRGLDQLTEEASIIVHGSVTSARIEPHPQLPNLMTLVVSLRVKETYKGAPQTSLTFRQYIWDFDANRKPLKYRAGEELVLLLGPVSEYGLSSPVGLDQGVFRISPDEKGRPVALNDRQNLRLFEHVMEHANARRVVLPPRTARLAIQHRQGGILLTDLKDAIRTFARQRQ